MQIKKIHPAVIIAGALAIIILILAIIGVASFIQWKNFGARSENALETTYKNNMNISAQYSLKLKEAASIPDMYVADLTKVIQADMEGRYGSSGSQAVFQFLQERQLPFEGTLYVKLQQIIEAGRTEFKVAQTRLLDQRNAYKNQLDYVWSGFWLGVAGYPKTDLSKYDPVITEQTVIDFNTKRQAPIQLR